MERGSRSIRNIGLDLGKLGQRELEELSEFLEKVILESLDDVLTPTTDVQVTIELELSEHLDVSVDLTISSPTPLSPDVLARVDAALDKALEVFEGYVYQKHGRTNGAGETRDP